jgi:hypothetical protein
MPPTLCKFIKISIQNEEIKIPLSLSQALTTHHVNVFALILSMREGRAGIAWIPSNKLLFFPISQEIKSLAIPQNFLFASTLILLLLFSLSFSSFKRFTVCFSS